jgi:hypothetical protein
LDPNQLFREAIGRAVATALSQALMNQTPPQHQMTLPPGSLPAMPVLLPAMRLWPTELSGQLEVSLPFHKLNGREGSTLL